MIGVGQSFWDFGIFTVPRVVSVEVFPPVVTVMAVPVEVPPRAAATAGL